jgi:ABC-type lipoprotein release transport system permease subunit
VTSHLFRVKGIFRTGSADIDGFFAIVPLASAAEVTGRPDAVTQLSIHLSDSTATPEATTRATAALGGPGVEVLDWQHALPEMWRMIRADASANNAFLGVMGIMVALGVLNTILMSVMERMREFGVLLAVGMTPSRLALLIVFEGLFLGLTSALLGAGLGALLTWPMIVYGIDLSSFMGESYELAGLSLSTTIHAAWDWPRMIATAFLSILFCMMAAAYPAWKAARLRPVEAMHHV